MRRTDLKASLNLIDSNCDVDESCGGFLSGASSPQALNVYYQYICDIGEEKSL